MLTMVRGRVVVNDGKLVGSPNLGLHIARSRREKPYAAN